MYSEFKEWYLLYNDSNIFLKGTELLKDEMEDKEITLLGTFREGMWDAEEGSNIQVQSRVGTYFYIEGIVD